jgi:hypothetical protein
MNINVNGSETLAILTHDVFGAMYLTYKNKLYLLYISALDELDELDEIDELNELNKLNKSTHKLVLIKLNPKIMIPINNESIDYYKGNILPLLSGKSLKEKINETISQNEKYFPDEKYFPEEKYFIVNILNKKKEKNVFYNDNNDNHNDNDNDNDNDNEYDDYDDDIVGGFAFYGFKDNMIINETIEQSTCNYDTLIADGDISSNKFIFMAESKNEQNSFRITIFTSGKFRLNIIGTSITLFKLIDVDENLKVVYN